MSDGQKDRGTKDGKAPPPSPSNGGRQIDVILDRSLRDVLNPAQKKQVVERLRPQLESVLVQKFHSGPIPSSEEFAGYHAISPDYAKRIIDMAERDQQAFIDANKYKAQSDSTYRMASLFAGLAALVILVGGMTFLATQGRIEAVYAVGAMGAAGIISAFVNSRYGR